ncbi:MAG: M23 family metallopeptidase [Candidatus Liptonbacteria bacterium]|nr:M23 family metallopeptidase [Candidatus Liptonbacteria bacterium]
MFLATLIAATALILPQGGTNILEVGELGINAPVSSVIFDGKPVPVFKRSGKTYLLLMADVGKPAGAYLLRISHGQECADIPVLVQPGNFRTIRKKATYKPLALPPKVRALKEAERQPMLQALKQGEPGRIWRNIFCPPLSTSRVSGEFGLRRAYRNHVSTHRGVDLVPESSLVARAISDARVLWAEDRELYLEGKIVVLDHGQGILSLYMHLSEIRVKTGDNVTQGQTIGVVGSTGNSTGIHLHLAIIAGGAHVDPLKFIEAFQNLK